MYSDHLLRVLLWSCYLITPFFLGFLFQGKVKLIGLCYSETYRN